MILGSRLGPSGDCGRSINDTIDGLRDFPVLGAFFQSLADFRADLFSRHTDIRLCGHHDGCLAMDSLCSADLYDFFAV